MTYIFYSNYNDWQYQTGISLVLELTMDNLFCVIGFIYALLLEEINMVIMYCTILKNKVLFAWAMVFILYNNFLKR